MSKIDDFVGLPWQDRGRGPDGYDCWGLFVAVFRAGTGVELPSHDGEYASASDRDEVTALVSGDRSSWTPVDPGKEKMYDAALMLIAGRYHVGVVVRRGLVLHLPAGKTSVVEPITRFRCVEILRHEALA